MYEDGEPEDTVVFLGAGGAQVVPFPLDGRQAVAWRYREVTEDDPELLAGEVVPGYAIALLAMGDFNVNGRETVRGAFVVVRRVT